MVKKGKGRKITSMKKIENCRSLYATFSKRRVGLFKKASALCILCDANVGLIVNSPANKVYSFGHPSLDMIIKKYHGQVNVDYNFTSARISTSENLTSQELYNQLNKVEESLSIHKDREKKIDDLIKDHQGQFWWDGSAADGHTISQLDMVEAMLEELKEGILRKLEYINVESNTYVGQSSLAATTFVGPNVGMRYAYPQVIAQTQGIGSFDPTINVQSTGFVLPYEHRLQNDFNNEIPNSFINHVPLLGGSRSSLEPSTSEARPTNQIDPGANAGVGPSGTNIYYGSASDYNKVYY